MMPDFPIRGYEYYDYRHDVVNTTFVNFEDNATRKTGALSYLLFTSFGVSSNNAIEQREIRATPSRCISRRWRATPSGPTTMETARPRRPRRSATRTARSAAGPNAYVLINDGVNDSIATDAQACEIKPDLERCGVQGRCRAPECWRPGGGGGFGGARSRRRSPAVLAAGAPGAAPVLALLRAVLRRPGAGAPGARPVAVAGARLPQPPVILSRNGKDYTVTGHQRTRRYRDQGDHRKAVRVPQR